MSGKFIVFDGIDGCGKTTLSKAVAQALNARWMCFPNRATLAGKAIDGWLKGEWSVKRKAVVVHSTVAEGFGDAYRAALGEAAQLDAAVFQALQVVNRLEVAAEIRASLANGVNIVCDRYWSSAYAYGGADGLPLDWLRLIHAELPRPDAMILVRVPLSVAEERVKARGGDKAEVYERRGAAYQQDVCEKFTTLWKEESGKARPHTDRTLWYSLDASRTKEDTLSAALEVLRGVL